MVLSIILSSRELPCESPIALFSQMDSSMKPPERAGGLMGRGSKRKRGPEENGGGPLSEPEEGPPASFTTTSSSWDKYRKGERKRKRKREEKVGQTFRVTTCRVFFKLGKFKEM